MQIFRDSPNAEGLRPAQAGLDGPQRAADIILEREDGPAGPSHRHTSWRADGLTSTWRPSNGRRVIKPFANRLQRLLAGAMTLGIALAAGAHTRIEQATPASGAVLGESPSTIEIKFKHAVRMTSVIVVHTTKAERKLAFEPATRTRVVTIANPDLAPGRNELRWKALSDDGHVIGGSLTYVVEPAGANP